METVIKLRFTTQLAQVRSAAGLRRRLRPIHGTFHGGLAGVHCPPVRTAGLVPRNDLLTRTFLHDNVFGVERVEFSQATRLHISSLKSIKTRGVQLEQGVRGDDFNMIKSRAIPRFFSTETFQSFVP